MAVWNRYDRPQPVVRPAGRANRSAIIRKFYRARIVPIFAARAFRITNSVTARSAIAKPRKQNRARIGAPERVASEATCPRSSWNLTVSTGRPDASRGAGVCCKQSVTSLSNTVSVSGCQVQPASTAETNDQDGKERASRNGRESGERGTMDTTMSLWLNSVSGSVAMVGSSPFCKAAAASLSAEVVLRLNR